MAKAVDVGDVGQVKRRKSRADLKRERELLELYEILATEGGRAFIWRLLRECKHFAFIGTHPQGTFRELGQKDVGLWVQNEVFTSDLDAYTLMHREAREREQDG